ncbi:MAG: alpha/beta fold hydrolase [Thaumarchaeota archaeon]|nr:alpha/beta fold hydrolase [Nitrososphaerota archaeon]
MVNGIRIYYEIQGKGVPIVLISGTGFHSQVWCPFQVPFFSKHFMVLISDHRGTGYSDKPDQPYSTKIFAEDIVALMDYLNLPAAHVLGHSMGGRVAQWIALEHPDRVRSLVLASSGSGNYSNRSDFVRGVSYDVALELAEKGLERYLRDHVESEFFFTPEFSRKDSQRYREAVDIHLVNMPPLKAYLRHVVARQMHETTTRLGEIKTPTLVMIGEGDTHAGGTGSHMQAAKVLAGRIRNAQFAVVKGANHGIFWENPEEGNKIVLAFLKVH